MHDSKNVSSQGQEKLPAEKIDQYLFQYWLSGEVVIFAVQLSHMLIDKVYCKKNSIQIARWLVFATLQSRER